MAAEHAKEACFFLLDVTETMGPHLADAKTVLKGLLTHKVLFAKQDVVGIGLVGTEGTDNMVHDEMGDDQYEHVSVVKQVAKTTFSSLKAVDDARCEGFSGDLIDGVVVACDAICKFVRKCKFGKRVVLVTDGLAYAEADEGLDEIADNMAKEDIRFTVLGVGLSAEVKPEEGGGPREQFVRCLGRFRERLGDRFELKELSETLQREGQLGEKATKPTKAFQGQLQIGGMALPVVCWRRVSKTAPPKFVNVSKAALNDEEQDGDEPRAPDQTVSTERRYFVPSQDEDIPPESRGNAYVYGKDQVPVTAQDEEQMKFAVAEKCLQLVGMVPQEKAPRHWFMGNAKCLVSADGAPYAHSALSALGLAMEEERPVQNGPCPA
jgi:hypothetical protein